MTRIHLFADEAGNFDFSNGRGATRYFILTTVAFFDDYQACRDLESIRYQLAWDGIDHPGPFHATTDPQTVRDKVYESLAPHAFRVDATILEKKKAQPQLRVSNERFYQYAWYYHLKYVAPRICGEDDEILIVAASIGTKARRDAFHIGVRDVVAQTVPTMDVRSVHWPNETDAGLQIADYCCWAIQRKWERGDDRSHGLIIGKIQSEFDLFQPGTQTYY